MRAPLVPCLLCACLCACGGDDPAPPPVEGGWVEGVEGLWTLERARLAEEIGAIGYAGGWQTAGEASGVLVHDAARTQPGLDLYCSGHAAEAFLIDAAGEVLHRWHLDYDDLPDAPPLDGDHQRCWRRVRLLPDGGLLAVHGGRALVRLDRDSRPLWVLGERVHHDVQVGQAGEIRTLTRAQRLLPRLDPGRAVVDDFVLTLSPDGEVLGRISVAEALLDSPWADLVLGAARTAARTGGELLHTNSLRLLRGDVDLAAFAAGNLLLCARDLDLVFVLDPARRRVVWARQGDGRMPHDPRELASGRVLLFDNLGASAPGHGLASRLIELDPRSGRIEWEWRADPPGAFFSRFCGTAERLANGNTLVTESGAGRAFELTAGGELVWLFQSPHRAGRHGELVAALFEVERIPEEAVAGWLGR